jgi:fructosamine-3-kinase
VTFVKRLRPGGHPEELRAEAEGLRWLADPGHLRVPEIVEVTEERLVLERIEGDAPLDEEAFGRGLALTHAAGADRFGWHRPIRFGSLTLPNDARGDFPSFYADCRLRPLAEGTEFADLIERVIERLPEIAGPDEPPARVHGDLWRGNVLAGSGGEPVLIDPWAHGGHREVDLAMLDLFGGLSPRFLAAYHEANPLADGWRQRLPLWQLFPLLVHAEVFGGGYRDSVVRTARSLLR